VALPAFQAVFTPILPAALSGSGIWGRLLAESSVVLFFRRRCDNDRLRNGFADGDSDREEKNRENTLSNSRCSG